jgi:hypothetical protein
MELRVPIVSRLGARSDFLGSPVSFKMGSIGDSGSVSITMALKGITAGSSGIPGAGLINA